MVYWWSLLTQIMIPMETSFRVCPRQEKIVERINNRILKYPDLKNQNPLMSDQIFGITD